MGAGSTRRDPLIGRSGAIPGDAVAFGLIAAVFAAGWFLVGGRTNVPIMDDWLYGGIVQQFLSTGRIRIPEFSAIYPIAQILWGALFCRVFGFSFGALRASTICLAAAGCFAGYATLRELGQTRTTALLVALTIALNPVFFALTFSFMTDVPFTSLLLVATWLYISGISRQSLVRWWAAGGVAVVAFLVRPVGLGIPVAAALALWRQRRPGAWLAASLASLGTMAALWFALPHMFGSLDFAATRLDWLRYWTDVTPLEYAEYNLGLLLTVALPVAPLLMAAMWSRRTALLVGGVSAALGACVLAAHERPQLLDPSQTWSLCDFAVRALIEGDVSLPAWASRAEPLILAVGVVLAAALVVGAARWWREHERARRPELVAVAVGAAQLGLVNLLWLYNDRYYLVLLPAAAFLATRLGRVKPAVAACLLAVWAFVAVSGTRDAIAFNAAVASAAGRLEASGVAPADIDAGYVSNGWRLYLHPERLPAGSDRRDDVPFVTGGKTPPPYAVSNTVPPGATVLDTILLPDAVWQATDRIYVVKR
jgi:Dolichyl-phosphate-mannose-protein mannosyltransferase